MATAAEGVDAAEFLISVYDGWALELLAISLAAFLHRYDGWALELAVAAISLAAFLLRYDGWALELAVAAISLAAFLLRYAVVPYANHMAASLSGLHAVVASDAAIAGYCRASGLDGATIARLPCFVAVRRTDEGEATAATDCPVCLGAVEEGETVRALPFCRHVFHARCVDAWLRLRPTCPVCRATFR